MTSKKPRVLTPPYFVEEGECAPIYCSTVRFILHKIRISIPFSRLTTIFNIIKQEFPHLSRWWDELLLRSLEYIVSFLSLYQP